MKASSLPPTTPAKTPKQDDVSALLATLDYFHPLDETARRFMRERLKPAKINRRKLLLREGDICQHIYFIRSGAIRGYVVEGLQDITTWITVENEMVTSIASLNERAPCTENIQTIEDCELLTLTYDDLEELYQISPSFNITSRKLLQRYYWDAEQRAFIARLTKAENKYRHFLLRHQHLANRIPLKFISSYLGMTLETLSRIRKKISLAPSR